jgi:hypothetical protein
MAEVVNLDEILPGDIDLVWRGATYVLPGDIDVETTFGLQKLLAELGRAEEATLTAEPGSEEEQTAHDRQRDVSMKIEKELLRLLQTNHPELEKLPFGIAGFKYVLGLTLAKLGFSTVASDPEPDPPKPARAPAKAKSKRSTSSRAS